MIDSAITGDRTRRNKPSIASRTVRVVARTAAQLLALSTAAFAAQAYRTQAAKVADGRELYARYCVACHGSGAQGTDRGPQLAGNRSLRKSNNEQVGDVIRHGISEGGMPAFDLPAAEIDALAAFVHSLNYSAFESGVTGNPEAGKRYFEGVGRCASCHMVCGIGSPIGPDLSSVGTEMTVNEIKEALFKPDVEIAPGYDLVTVQLREGGTLRGFARNRGDFDIDLQDLEGNFHLLHEGQFSSVMEDKRSLMPPVSARPRELNDLIAYLSQLTGVRPGMVPAVQPTNGGINFSRLLHPKPGDWLTYNGNLDGNRYSELNQINTTNVSRLELKWMFPVPQIGLEVTPIVADGIMYVTGPNQAYALDALTGREIWKYSRQITPGLSGDGALGTNRGVAVLGDKIFMVTDSAHLIALNRVTGSLVWEQTMPDGLGQYGATSAPLVVRDMVITGVAGADEGIRGFLTAYKASTGERLWRFWTIPRKGEPGSETWKGKEPVWGGGSTWLTGSYDLETDTLFWSTGNPWPDDDDRERGGDNLYTDCILALDPATGKLKWHYQFTPHDLRDWDATEPNVLVDTRYEGEERKVLLHADRNGFFYVFDRTSGKLLLARQFAQRVNWALRHWR